MDKEQFYGEIDKIVLDLLKKHQDFYSLMKSRRGIHPIDIKLSLDRLYRGKRISANVYKKVVKSARDKGKVGQEYDNLLPVPHLLDYDWRFSLKGKKKMHFLINKYCKKDTVTIAFVGTPSLFKMFFSEKETKNKYILIDKNADKHVKYITRYATNFSYIKYNIMDSKPLNIQADIVVMDPPWYLLYNKLFLQFAETILSDNGRVICVLPPKYTRKDILEEFEELRYFMEELGMISEHYMRNIITYNTPPFEKNALRANGIYCMPEGWRTGDILIAKRVNKKMKDCIPVVIEENQWEEISIGIVRYKLKTNNKLEIDKFDLAIEKIYPNNIYPSVKRSASKGEKVINIWTSGNRVFYCSNISLFYYILMEYSMFYGHYDLDINVKIEADFNIKLSDRQKEGILKSIKLIEEINKKEQQEYGMWGKLL